MRARHLALVLALAALLPLRARGQVTGLSPSVFPSVDSDASGSAPMIGTVLATCTVKTPGGYRFQNQSAVTLQMVLDNGASGTHTVFVYGPGASVGSQGGDSSPDIPWFIGRVRVAGVPGSQFALRCN